MADKNSSWHRKLRGALEGGENPFGLDPEDQRRQMEVLSQGFGEDPETNRALMNQNYGQLTGEPYMADLDPIESLSEADLDALLAGDVDGLSDAAVNVLSSLPDDQFNALIGATPQITPQATNARENLGAALGGMFGNQAAGQAIAESPAADFLAGVGRSTEQLVRGVKQMASSPEEALALGKQEERSRKMFEEFDEGIGLEDAGQAMFDIGTLLIPGASPINAVSKGMKAVQAIKNLGGTMGGNALLLGILEGTKAKTAGESRGKDAAAAAGSAYMGGKLINGIGKVLGPAAGMLGLGTLTGASRSEISNGLYRTWRNKLWGRKPITDPAEVRLAAAEGGVEARQLTKEAAKAQAKEVTAGQSQAFEAWLDVVQGTKSPKTGKRLASKGIAGAAPGKAAKEDSALDIVSERNRIVSTLLQDAMIYVPGKATPDFNLKGTFAAWEALKTNPEFRKIYGSVSKTGKWTPNKAAKGVEEFFEKLMTQQNVKASDVLRQGVKDVQAVARQGREAVKGVRGEIAGGRKQRRDTRAAQVGWDQLTSEGFLEEAAQYAQNEGWQGFLDFFATTEERARALAGE